MKKLIVLGLVIGLFLLSGCAAGIVGKIPQVDDDFASVFIARRAGIIGCAVKMLIKINDEDFIRIACGMKTNFKIPAGKTTKISSVSSLVADHFPLDPKKGEEIYFGIDCNYGACWFDKLSKQEYEKIAASCSEDLAIKQ